MVGEVSWWLNLCQVWWFQFQPFWFYRTDRQNHTHTQADDRYTHAATVGVSIISTVCCTSYLRESSYVVQSRTRLYTRRWSVAGSRRDRRRAPVDSSSDRRRRCRPPAGRRTAEKPSSTTSEPRICCIRSTLAGRSTPSPSAPLYVEHI